MSHPLDGELVDTGVEHHHNLEHEENEDQVSSITLHTLLSSNVEEALSGLSPNELLQLERNVQRIKRQKNTPTKRGSKVPKSEEEENGDPNIILESPISHHQQMQQMQMMQMHHHHMLDDLNSNAAYVNLPASAAVVDIREGIEWITFQYTNKGRLQEYSIRIDCDHITLEDIPHDFKVENCVYPRAMCAQENYVGNRWEYETTCNEIAWKLAWLNATVLNGKRGLIQRAVDSYRNRFEESRSRRVIRQEKLSNGTLRRRTTDISGSPGYQSKGPKMLTFLWVAKGVTSKCRIRVDLENADLDEMDETFKRNNCIYPRALTEKATFEENQCNEISWKLAWLNPSRLAGKKAILQKAVDAYRSKFIHKSSKRNSFPNDMMYTPRSMNQTSLPAHALNDLLMEEYVQHAQRLKAEEFSEIVANTLQQALSQEYGQPNHHNVFMEAHQQYVNEPDQEQVLVESLPPHPDL